jgi:hypothetical protein
MRAAIHRASWSRTMKQAAVSSMVHATSSQPFAQGAPVLFRLAFHGRPGRILNLEPMVDPAGRDDPNVSLHHAIRVWIMIVTASTMTASAIIPSRMTQTLRMRSSMMARIIARFQVRED